MGGSQGGGFFFFGFGMPALLGAVLEQKTLAGTPSRTGASAPEAGRRLARGEIIGGTTERPGLADRRSPGLVWA